MLCKLYCMMSSLPLKTIELSLIQKIHALVFHSKRLRLIYKESLGHIGDSNAIMITVSLHVSINICFMLKALTLYIKKRNFLNFWGYLWTNSIKRILFLFDMYWWFRKLCIMHKTCTYLYTDQSFKTGYFILYKMCSLLFNTYT